VDFLQGLHVTAGCSFELAANMTLFLTSALFLTLAGYGIHLQRKSADSSECSGSARVFEGPDGTRYTTTSIFRINEFDPGPPQTWFEPGHGR
jgi:hypothetical protein